ncbi:MAG: 1,3-beta-galactosyl-N-acetylhexosamine phosphorylase [Candidatus Scatosoma sp.]
MSKGRVTVPTDSGYVEGTKKIIDLWGADAVRDCDGTQLPAEAKTLAPKVYKTYFLARGDNRFAYEHYEFLQNVALISETNVATEEGVLKIDLLKGYFKQQLAVNPKSPEKYWRVKDRTAGKITDDWEYNGKEGCVIIRNPEYMHEYTVSFFAKTLWDPTQIYNYTANGWTREKDRDIDPIFPQVTRKMAENLEEWLKSNNDVSVVRFTTFFYHFFLIHKEDGGGKYFDWFGYAMSASPAMLDAFERETGETIDIEDVVDGGYYANHFRMPTKKFLRYMDFVEKFVSKTVRKFVDILHAHGKEAMMFLGDNWIGGELYGEHFKDMALDAVVGSVNSGATLRMLSEIPHVKYTEARFLPYFFPDTLPSDEIATQALNSYWLLARRAVMRKPVDRIGFGGYLKLAAQLPVFTAAVTNVCEEFREIYRVIEGKEPYTAVKVAVLNAWGKKRSWMNHMVCQDAPYQKIYKYQGVLEALSGLPVHVDFLNFRDVENGALSGYDVAINYGDRDTSFSGGDEWKNPAVTANVRKFIYEGGGFIGMGEPSATQYNGKFFQLADALGVDEELSFSLIKHKYNYKKEERHFITEDAKGKTDYGGRLDNIYALDGAQILDIDADENLGLGISAGHVRMAAKGYGKGRCFYMTGMKYNNENSRLLYRALLWCAHKEDKLYAVYSSHTDTECNYYPESKKYAVANNGKNAVTTEFYDINGNKREISLAPLEIKWITAE